MSDPDRLNSQSRAILTRRKLMAATLPVIAGTAVSVRRARAAGQAPAAQSKPAVSGANETLRVGVIGCGARGPYLGFLFQSQPNVQVTAVCDVYEKNLAQGAELVSRVGGKPKLYSDYRRLLDDRSIDAVVIVTNIHWHVIPAIAACAAGKDVYLEKPVGASVAEGRAAVQAARRHNRIVQMGTQQHSWAHYHEAVDLIRSGALGDIFEVRVWDVGHAPLGSPPDSAAPPGLDWDFWLGPAPNVAYNRNRHLQHDWFFDYAGGWQLAWGVHHFDILHWAMGVEGPSLVSAAGGKWAFPDDNREWPDTFSGACAYPAGLVSKAGFVMKYTCRTGSARPIDGCLHGKAFHGTQATLVLSRQGFELWPEGKNATTPARKIRSAKSEHEVVIDHVRSFLDCLRARRTPAAEVEVGHRASIPGHLMNIAWRAGRTLKWDPAGETFPHDPPVSSMLHRQYRPGYEPPA